MKKIILLLSFSFFTINAFCQTVTIIDLKRLSRDFDADKILVSKSFRLVEVKRPHKKRQSYYIINDRTPKAESIQIGPAVKLDDGTVFHDVNYQCRDTNYVKRIMKQVTMSGMEVTATKPQQNQTAYIFDNKKLTIQITVMKNPAMQSSVQIHRKM